MPPLLCRYTAVAHIHRYRHILSLLLRTRGTGQVVKTRANNLGEGSGEQDVNGATQKLHANYHHRHHKNHLSCQWTPYAYPVVNVAIGSDFWTQCRSFSLEPSSLSCASLSLSIRMVRVRELTRSMWSAKRVVDHRREKVCQCIVCWTSSFLAVAKN